MKLHDSAENVIFKIILDSEYVHNKSVHNE